jgi:hypothetical protein
LEYQLFPLRIPQAHTDGIVNAKKKGSASNALTSLAG